MIYIVIVSVLLGLVIGYSSPLVIPVAYSKIFSVALVAALDAAFGGLRAVVSERFDKRVFVTGFFSNTLLAAALVFIGDRLGIDLYYVALLAFGFRMFKNLAMLRRYLLRDYRSGGHKSMLRNP
ncbi:small basic family protein [Selenomonas sp.]|jgi:small basic protein|uniref:small basic family protein n=1 Tax=Selenomonas sp. TaxID=2053611 RepID=UPI001CB251CA|nr:small basic family protein [Selenomonas sp.]MBF1688070.1 small basic family protein [Selenomonas sp.]MBF1694657.1 small basic family protein [Selenomonas sp.]MBF1704369.1 small basic family protein [Selenomonas sp.]